MTMLDTLLDSYIKQEKYKDVPESEKLAVRNALCDKVLTEAVQMIEAQKRDDMNRRLKEEARRKEKELRQKLHLTVILETVLLAFLVGLFVNQTTNVFGMCIQPSRMLLFSIISIIICLGLIVLMAIVLSGIRLGEDN